MKTNNLETLCAALNTLGTEGFDMTNLPTFGGEEPRNTLNVWSWDAKRMIVQRSDGFKIVPRD